MSPVRIFFSTVPSEARDGIRYSPDFSLRAAPVSSAATRNAGAEAMAPEVFSAPAISCTRAPRRSTTVVAGAPARATGPGAT